MLKKYFILISLFILSMQSHAIPSFYVSVKVIVTFHPVTETFYYHPPGEVRVGNLSHPSSTEVLLGCLDGKFAALDTTLKMSPHPNSYETGTKDNPTEGVWTNRFVMTTLFLTNMDENSYRIKDHYVKYYERSDGQGGEQTRHISGDSGTVDVQTAAFYNPFSSYYMDKNTFKAVMNVECIDSDGDSVDKPLNFFKSYPVKMYLGHGFEATRIDDELPDVPDADGWKLKSTTLIARKPACDSSEVEAIISYEETWETTLSGSFSIRDIPASLEGTIKKTNKNSTVYPIKIETGERGLAEEWVLSKKWRIDEFHVGWKGDRIYLNNAIAEEEYRIVTEIVETCSEN